MNNQGFTLLELAVVLFLLTVVLGGIMQPLSAVYETRTRAQTREQGQTIRESLLGFAIQQQRLPCPASSATTGSEDCSLDDAEGFLPWQTLGLIDRVDPAGNAWRYRVDSAYTSAPIAISVATSDDVMVVDYQDDPSLPVAIESSVPTLPNPVPGGWDPDKATVAIWYSLGVNQVAEGENALGEVAGCGNASGYDDPGHGTGCPAGLPLYEQGIERVGFDDVLFFINHDSLIYILLKAERLTFN